MSVEIVMPKLSDTMEEGKILKWLKQPGDAIAAGETIAEVETDKADMELEADAGGVLRELKVREGESAPVGAVIALLDEDGRSSATPQGGRPAKASDAESAAGRPVSAGTPAREDAPKASPAAREVAQQRGVDLRAVRGSGPGGRIVREDVEAVAAEASTPAAPRTAAPPEATAPSAGARVPERRELSRMRQSIARRMSEAFRDIPHFYVTAEIDMSEAVRLKGALQRGELYATPITYTHMVLKATALALKRHPRLNASFRDDAIEIRSEVNLGMAVAVEDGLIVPILRHADELTLEQIAVEARRLVEQTKQGRFTSEDLSGGTFTVSNMGMLDIEHFTAVINPPQAAILAVGSIRERPIVRDGALVAAHTMRVTLSCDHRVVDGVVGGRFLEELKRLLENPIVLVVRER